MRLSIISIIIFDFLLWMTVEGESESWIESIVSSLTSSANAPHRRSKRSLVEFQNVIQCFQPWINVLSVYGDYGCYCGAGGFGTPLDDTDKCCYYHDKCYAEALLKAKSYLEWGMGSYFTSYNYDCVNKSVICRENENSPYQHMLCECDRIVSECFLSNRKSYSRHLYDLNTDKYCKENADYHDLKLERHILNKLYTCELNVDQDRCCVSKGYNSAFEKCCDGTLRHLPADGEFLCCSDQLYDIKTGMCCHGTLYPKQEHFQCCGTSGDKVDMSTSKCVDGKVVPRDQTLFPSNETTLT